MHVGQEVQRRLDTAGAPAGLAAPPPVKLDPGLEIESELFQQDRVLGRFNLAYGVEDLENPLGSSQALLHLGHHL